MTSAAPLAEIDAPADDAAARCAACGHDLAVHDAIGLRFCQASLANALVRGCLCPKV